MAAAAPMAADDVVTSDDLISMQRHICTLRSTPSDNCCSGAFTLADITYLRASFKSLDREGRRQLLTELIVHCPRTASGRVAQYVLLGNIVCKSMFILLCGSSKNSVSKARHAAAVETPRAAPVVAAAVGAAAPLAGRAPAAAFPLAAASALHLLNTRAAVQTMLEVLKEATALREYDRATVERNRHRDQSSALATIVTLGPVLGRRLQPRDQSHAAVAAIDFLTDIQLQNAQDWGKRKHKQRGLHGFPAGAPLLQLPACFEVAAFYPLYNKEVPEPHISLQEFSRHARDIRNNMNIVLQHDNGDMPLCNICGLAGASLKSAQASGNEHLIANVKQGIEWHLWLVRQQRRHMIQLAELSHSCNEQLLAEQEPPSADGGRMRAFQRLSFRAQDDQVANATEPEVCVDVFLTDRPSVLACAHFAGGTPKILSRAAVVRYSCQATLHHTSSMNADGTFTRNGTVTLLYIPNNVFKLGANFTLDGFVDSLLALPPLRVPGRQRCVILVLDNTVRASAYCGRPGSVSCRKNNNYH